MSPPATHTQTHTHTYACRCLAVHEMSPPAKAWHQLPRCPLPPLLSPFVTTTTMRGQITARLWTARPSGTSALRSRCVCECVCKCVCVCMNVCICVCVCVVVTTTMRGLITARLWTALPSGTSALRSRCVCVCVCECVCVCQCVCMYERVCQVCA